MCVACIIIVLLACLNKFYSRNLDGASFISLRISWSLLNEALFFEFMYVADNIWF